MISGNSIVPADEEDPEAPLMPFIRLSCKSFIRDPILLDPPLSDMFEDAIPARMDGN